MGFRLRSIRQRIFLLVLLPVLSLIGLYIFATSISAQNALSLTRAAAVKNAVQAPISAFLAQIDAERPMAMSYLSSPTGAHLATLEVQKSKTTTAAATLQAALTSANTSSHASVAEKQAISTLLNDLSGLPALRSQIASQIIPKSRAFATYNSTVADSYQVLNEAISQQKNSTLATQGLAVNRMSRSAELLLQENALLVGDVAARSFPGADRQAFTELVGARRTLYNATLPDLNQPYRAYYQRAVTPMELGTLSTLENSVIASANTNGPPPVQPRAWQKAVTAVTGGLSRAGTQSAGQLTSLAQSDSSSTYLGLFLAGGLGLLAVIISVIVSFFIGRGLIRELATLRQSALELANERLPAVVERLAAGQDVDVAAEVPSLPASSDEIGQVRQAFLAVQQTAVEAAVGQAKLRRGVSDIFRNLARRSQSLLHRQLALLDAMERRAREPEELADLFRIDHLTTRMRRHAESLIILSGEAPSRGWRNPVPFVDVLRAAVAEVEDYTRIRVTAKTRAGLTGSAVADIIHLVAELAENAVIFSPPNTPVLISGDVVGRGFAVEIEDRGLGLSEERRGEINELLANPPPFDLSGSEQLGLFVASQLAKKHNIHVGLRASPYGGTTAIVLIPLNLVVPEGSYARGVAEGDQQSLTPLSGRHATRDDAGGFAADSRESGTPAPAANGSGLHAADAPADTGPQSADKDWTTGHASTGDTGALDPGTLAPWPDVTSTPSPWEDTGWPAVSGFDPLAALPEEASNGDGVPSGNGGGAGSSSANGFPDGTGEAAGNGASADHAAPESGEANHANLADGTNAAHDANAADSAGPEEGLLPRRIRRASLAPQLRRDAPATKMTTDTDLTAAELLKGRSPEQARSTLSAIQQGWERGRSVFDSKTDNNSGEQPEDESPADVSAGNAADAGGQGTGHTDT
jgi:signal transduction histidine kinase